MGFGRSASIKLDRRDAKISRLYLLPTNTGSWQNEKKKKKTERREKKQKTVAMAERKGREKERKRMSCRK